MSNNTPKFLIVDDSKDCRELLQVILTSLGCECECVSHAEHVLERLKNIGPESLFDAIFIDILMPDITGLELAEKLRKNPETKDIPRIMVTALDKYSDIIEGYNSGGDIYLTKPVNTEQISHALDLIFSEHDEKDKDMHFLPEA